MLEQVRGLGVNLERILVVEEVGIESLVRHDRHCITNEYVGVPRHLHARCDAITSDLASVAKVLTAACETILAMSQRSNDRGEDNRRRFVADPDALTALGLTLEQLSDPDVHLVVIRREHPEFEEALQKDRSEIEGSDGPMNPRLHLTIHEIVATQLWDDSPPEVWDTVVRLLEAGYERHEILHMLARPVSDQIWAALHDERPYERERHVTALQALPGSWEQERTSATAAKRHDTDRKQARRAARAARQRNRRPR